MNQSAEFTSDQVNIIKANLGRVMNWKQQWVDQQLAVAILTKSQWTLVVLRCQPKVLAVAKGPGLDAQKTSQSSTGWGFWKSEMGCPSNQLLFLLEDVVLCILSSLRCRPSSLKIICSNVIFAKCCKCLP